MTIGSNLQNDILMYLEALGYPAYNIMQASKSGVSDIVACIEGRFAAIEVKAGRDTVKALQEIKQRKVRRAKGYAIIGRSLEDVAMLVEEIKNEQK